MAATKNHRYFSPISAEICDQFDFELDEADVWDDGYEDVRRTEPRRPATNTRPLRIPARKAPAADHQPRSVPLNVPDWSKILRGDYRPRAAADWADDFAGGEDEGDEKVPPHEYLARNRAASLSVHEGIGRTLKGRDLSRVRNAIWKKTGFED